MVFGRKSKLAIAQQRQELAALQMQVRQMQQMQKEQRTVIAPSAPTEVHHHTRETVNNVPTFMPPQVAGEPAAAFIEPLMPTYVRELAEPALPAAVVADNWGMSPMTPVMALDGPPAVGPSEYIEHLQHLDGTWEHNSWWE
jgi:hypothetical protein